MAEWFPGYESAPERTPEEIEIELNRRTGYVTGECRSIPLSQASPAPAGKESKASFNIHVPRGGVRRGHAGGCGLNALGKKRKGGK